MSGGGGGGGRALSGEATNYLRKSVGMISRESFEFLELGNEFLN